MCARLAPPLATALIYCNDNNTVQAKVLNFAHPCHFKTIIRIKWSSTGTENPDRSGTNQNARSMV